MDFKWLSVFGIGLFLVGLFSNSVFLAQVGFSSALTGYTFFSAVHSEVK